MRDIDILNDKDIEDKLKYASFCSNLAYSILITFMLLNYVVTKNRKWLFYIFNSIIIITLFGNLIRDIFTTLDIYDKRPIYKDVDITNKYETNGMPSLHAMSVGYIIPYILNSEATTACHILRRMFPRSW